MRVNSAVLVPGVLAVAAVLLSGCDAKDDQNPGGNRDRQTSAEAPITSVQTDAQTDSVTARDVVEVGASVQFGDDGSLTWVEGRMATSSAGAPTVEPVAGAEPRSAKFADEVELLTPEGCTEPFGEIEVDAEGLGQTPCTRETYAQVEHYGPKIWLNADGEVIRIADRYHP